MVQPGTGSGNKRNCGHGGPGGHGPGHHGHWGRRGRMHRFLRPCILLSLAKESAHGYELLDRLANSRFLLHQPDVGTLYRNLRALEEEGAVESNWEPGEAGPSRRLYRLTPRGRAVLHEWAEILRAQSEAIAAFLETYEELKDRDKDEDQDGVNIPITDSEDSEEGSDR